MNRITEDQKKTLAMLHPNFPAEPRLIVPRGKMPEQLFAEIQASKDGKFLVAGQRGMGKTTELLRLFFLLKDYDFLPLFVQFGAQETITYPMLIDAMAQALLRQPGLKLNRGLQTRYQDWFAEEEDSLKTEEGTEGAASIGGQLYFVGGKKAVRHAKTKSKSKKSKIVKSLGHLLDVFNELVLDAEKVTSKRVVFIVDDVDKIQDVSSIERTFIHSPHIIYSIQASSIFTVPITYATSSLTRISGLSYGGIYRVPAIEIVSEAGEQKAPEIDFMVRVLKLRMPYNPLSDEILHRIVEYSGGVLIDAMRMARDICKRSILEAQFKVDVDTVEDEFQHLIDDYKFTFENSQLWQKLARICCADDKRVIMTDSLLPDLLYKVIVIEYRGEKNLWFDLHPAVRRLYAQNKEVIDKLG